MSPKGSRTSPQEKLDDNPQRKAPKDYANPGELTVAIRGGTTMGEATVDGGDSSLSEITLKFDKDEGACE